jgi:hypothetical protein
MTKTVRLKIDETIATAIENECDVMLVAGFRLAGCFALADDLVLIFQKI